MALVGGGEEEAEVCILRSPGIAASPISLLSMGGVCGRSLTARGKFSSLEGKHAPTIWHYDSVPGMRAFPIFFLSPVNALSPFRAKFCARVLNCSNGIPHRWGR